MREIKIRAWDNKHGIMLQGIELKKLLRYLLFQSCPNSQAYDLMKDHFEDIKWLEFTGLKDKNGVEIYEGDICKFTTEHPSIAFGKSKTIFFHHIAEVKWDNDDAGYFYSTQEDSEPYVKPWSVKSIEIIGNIHEHSHLIEEKI